MAFVAYQTFAGALASTLYVARSLFRWFAFPELIEIIRARQQVVVPTGGRLQRALVQGINRVVLLGVDVLLDQGIPKMVLSFSQNPFG